MLLANLAFTSNVLVIRALGTIEAVDVWLISCARFAVGLGLTWAVFRGVWQPRRVVTNRKLIERGVLGGLSVWAYYLTVVELGAGRATFINNTYVVFGAVMAVLALGERLRPALLVGGGVSLAGLALMTNLIGSAGGGPGLYDWVGIVTAVSSAWVVITIRQLHAAGEHTATIFCAQCAYGLVLCLVPALVNFVNPSLQAWGLLLLAGVCAGVGQLTMTRAFVDLTVAQGSLLLMLAPVGVAAGGAVFFGERFHPVELFGGLLILVGTSFPAWRRGR
jgi:drug/metabolite transporter (DMT)-like permease